MDYPHLLQHTKFGPQTSSNWRDGSPRLGDDSYDDWCVSFCNIRPSTHIAFTK